MTRLIVELILGVHPAPPVRGVLCHLSCCELVSAPGATVRIQIFNQGWQALEKHLYTLTDLRHLERHAPGARYMGATFSEADALVTWVNRMLSFVVFGNTGDQRDPWRLDSRMRRRTIALDRTSPIYTGVQEVGCFLAHFLHETFGHAAPSVPPAPPGRVMITPYSP